ncbi:MAG: PadR family transcriptional regulator [Blastochloris sp.]|nr:PadR family transcriptional regulator [Blastochloris sp.]
MVNPHDVLANFGRFVEPALLILVSLSDGPKHGYAMIEDIALFSATRLGAGTLYGAIARLEQQKFIEALPAMERRRPYRLTLQGQRVVELHVLRLQQVVTTGLQRLALSS